LTLNYGLGHTQTMPDTDTITELDLADYQFPHHEIDEMEAEDFGRACCNSIPCLRPEECGR
jgi:hypothetical protein